MLALGATISHASPGLITFQSRIVKPDGTALEASSVSFRFSVTDTVGSCVIYQEDFSSINMSASKGLISLSLGAGTKVFPAGPMPLPNVFNNYGSPLFNCQAGGTINAGLTDRRKLVMQFNDGSGWQTLPAMDINSNPFAMQASNAYSLGGFSANDYLRPAALTPCNPATEALTFNGTSFTCVAVGGGGSASYSAITGATGSNTIDNSNHAQTWNWSTATTQNPMSISANALTTGSLLNLTTSNNSLNSTNGLLNVANTGTSTTGTVARIQSNSTAGSGLTVLANGNVGIGTTSPWSALHVVGANANGRIALQNTTASEPAIVSLYNSNNEGLQLYANGPSTANLNLVSIPDSSVIRSDNVNGLSMVASAAGGVIKFATGGQSGSEERIRITSTGNVGIGTASPNRLLEVAGPVRISPAALPGSPAAGDIAVDSGDGNKLKVHNGTGWLTATATANGTTNRIPKYTAANTMGDSAITDDGNRITATRSIAAIRNTVGADTVNLNLSNTHTLAAVGGSAITIQNPTDGGVYNIVVSDTTSRTYTFTGCTASYYKPANAATTAATRTIYGLMTVDNGAGGWDCYITWSSGFQP